MEKPSLTLYRMEVAMQTERMLEEENVMSAVARSRSRPPPATSEVPVTFFAVAVPAEQHDLVTFAHYL